MSRRPFPWLAVVASVIASVSIALLAAQWIVGSDDNSDGVDPSVLVNGDTSGDTAVTGTLEVDEIVPDATFPLLDGGQGSISDSLGKPLVVNFWSSTCVPCRQEMPALQEVATETEGQVNFLGLAVIDSPVDAKKFVAETGVTYRQGLDPQSEIATAFGTIALPHTVFVRADGTVASVHNGALSEAEIRQLVGDLTT